MEAHTTSLVPKRAGASGKAKLILHQPIGNH
jgi:hypothetical protein